MFTETSSIDYAPKERQNRLHAFACVLILLFCALLIRPFAEIGISDDFSYVRTAQILAATGHIVYNHWASMPLGWQLYLGALCIKLFGVSFTAPRVAVFAVSLVNAYLLHRVATQSGLTAWNATLATLTVILSPAWLMMELNFMTDAGAICAVIAGVIGVLLLHKNAAAYQMFTPLWLPDNVTYAGVKQQNEIAGHAPVFLRLPYRLLLTFAMVGSVICSISLLRLRGKSADQKNEERKHERQDLTGYDAHFLLLAFAGAYTSLLIPRACIGMIFDRYLVPLMMVLVILALRFVQQRAGESVLRARLGNTLSFHLLCSLRDARSLLLQSRTSRCSRQCDAGWRAADFAGRRIRV